MLSALRIIAVCGGVGSPYIAFTMLIVFQEVKEPFRKVSPCA